MAQKKLIDVFIPNSIVTISTDEIQRVVDEAVLQERKACWESINKHIKKGKLSGDSWSQAAENNGLTLAANIIFKRGLGE